MAAQREIISIDTGLMRPTAPFFFTLPLNTRFLQSAISDRAP
jgi:hypothetical protein